MKFVDLDLKEEPERQKAYAYRRPERGNNWVVRIPHHQIEHLYDRSQRGEASCLAQKKHRFIHLYPL